MKCAQTNSRSNMTRNCVLAGSTESSEATALVLGTVGRCITYNAVHTARLLMRKHACVRRFIDIVHRTVTLVDAVAFNTMPCMNIIAAASRLLTPHCECWFQNLQQVYPMSSRSRDATVQVNNTLLLVDVDWRLPHIQFVRHDDYNNFKRSCLQSVRTPCNSELKATANPATTTEQCILRLQNHYCGTCKE